MIPDTEYRRRLISAQRPLPAVRVPLAGAAGAVCAEPIASRLAIPPFDNSSMDGYAVVASDVAAATPQTPVTLPVAADIPAGRTDRVRIETGQVARIMTGAPIPAGADAIVQVELSDGGTETVTFSGPSSDFIRRAGADVTVGDLIVEAGTRLTPRHLAAIASAGHGDVLIHPRPRVAVISTGTELRPPGADLAFGQIPNSNSILIATSLAREAEVTEIGIVSDDPADLRAALATIEADAIILSGGVSVGAYDVVKEVFGPEDDIWFGPVAMQPGKPQGFGHFRGMSVFALPGNPVSVYVTLHMMVRPALAVLSGTTGGAAPTFRAMRAASGWTCPPGRVQYIPVRRTGPGEVAPASAGGSGSHLVGTLARADGLVRVPAETEHVTAGDLVQFWEER